MLSDRIDEEFLLAVVEGDADDKENKHAECTVCEGCPREFSGSVSSVFEGLDDSGHRVEKHDFMQGRISDVAERINNRRSIHPEGYQCAEDIGQIAVFGSQRRDDESESQGQALNKEKKDGEEQQIPRRVQVHASKDKEQINDDERAELERETEHL